MLDDCCRQPMPMERPGLMTDASISALRRSQRSTWVAFRSAYERRRHRGEERDRRHREAPAQASPPRPQIHPSRDIPPRGSVAQTKTSPEPPVTSAVGIQGRPEDVKLPRREDGGSQSSVNLMRPRFFAKSHAGFDAFSLRLRARPIAQVSGPGTPCRSSTIRLSRSILEASSEI